MKVLVTIDFSADGDDTLEYQLTSLKQLLEDCDSAGISLNVLKMDVIEE